MEWLKTHKLHLISGAVILLLLVGTFFLGGNQQTEKPDATAAAVIAEAASEASAAAGNGTQTAVPVSPSPTAAEEAAAGPSPSPSQRADTRSEQVQTSAVPGTSALQETTENASAAALPGAAGAEAGTSAAPEPTAAGTEVTSEPAGVPEEQQSQPEQDQGAAEEPEPETEPVPAPETTQTPAQQPEEPQQTEAPAEAQCTVSISCETILSHQDACSDAVWSLVPEDGWILQPVTVDLQEGDTVFDILKRVCQEYGIQLEFSITPGLGSAYIEGIGNLYEFDAGSLSGWMYCVNGEYPNYGCSGYTVNAGDEICWRYTCDLGTDIGGSNT